MSRRTERLNSFLREEISDLIAHSLKDPRLAEMVSITRVSISPDLAQARVYVSILGSDTERQATLDALASAVPYLRRELRPRLNMRRPPELEFHYDDTIEQGSRILSLIDQVSRERGEAISF